MTTGDADVTYASITGPPGSRPRRANLFDSSPAFVVTWESGPCVTLQAAQCRVVDIVPTKTYSVVDAFEIAASAAAPTGSG